MFMIDLQNHEREVKNWNHMKLFKNANRPSSFMITRPEFDDIGKEKMEVNLFASVRNIYVLAEAQHCPLHINYR